MVKHYQFPVSQCIILYKPDDTFFFKEIKLALECC